MRLRVCGAAVVVLCAGCGGSSSGGGAQPSASASAAASGVSAADRADLTKRLVDPADFLGVAPQRPAFSTGDEIAQGDPRPDEAQAYRDEGLVAAAIEHFSAPRTQDAICTVLKFTTTNGAQRDVVRNTRGGPGVTVKASDVPNVPGAVGSDVIQGGTLVGRNVNFTIGAYEYVLGYAPADSGGPTRAEMAAAAAKWYEHLR